MREIACPYCGKKREAPNSSVTTIATGIRWSIIIKSKDEDGTKFNTSFEEVEVPLKKVKAVLTERDEEGVMLVEKIRVIVTEREDEELVLSDNIKEVLAANIQDKSLLAEMAQAIRTLLLASAVTSVLIDIKCQRCGNTYRYDPSTGNVSK